MSRSGRKSCNAVAGEGTCGRASIVTIGAAKLCRGDLRKLNASGEIVVQVHYQIRRIKVK